MESLGFGSKWIRWMKAYLSSASISVLIKGSPTIEFSSERGVHQVDPVSPFLFIIAAEGLNITTKRAISSGFIKGVEVGQDKIVFRGHQRRSRRLANRLNCATGTIPFNYLGMSIGVKMNKVAAWNN
ncbi:uncharacterized protein [Rutidosis leptorrhynchoides]|uniref:uncharacterized protein n=1 Tax=Rutidosis leptorrhynchoides TaxID=125765 RepID=UPI003A990DD5